MKKRLLCGVLAGLLFLSGCGARSQTPPPPEEDAPAQEDIPVQGDAVTFTDALGREVTVETPRRVVPLIGSFADVWCLAGGRDTLAATANDAWTQFDLGLGDDVVNLGSVSAPNLEALLAAEPDFVIGSTKTAADLELLDMLEEMEIPTAYFDVSSFEDYLAMLEICTQITGCTEAYTEYGLNVQAQIEEARSRAGDEAYTVLYVRATGSSCKVKNSQGTVLGEMLADLGCVNIADSETGLLETLSMETILVQDPDFVFIVLQGTDSAKARQTLETALLSNPAWNELSAVQEGRLFYMDQQLYNLKPNARWGEAYEKLADILYPAE